MMVASLFLVGFPENLLPDQFSSFGILPGPLQGLATFGI
jgi:hypothetical protein